MVNIYQGLNEEQEDKIHFKLKGNKIHFNIKESYIYEVDGEIIGYFNLTPIPELGCIDISAIIFEEFRHTGLGNQFLKNISDYVTSLCSTSSKYSDYEILLLLIESSNISAIKTAEKNGYSLDYTLFDGDVENELSGTSAYTKSIKNCKEKKR